MSENKRLKEYLESLNLKQVELSEKTGLPKQRIYELMHMKANAGLDTIRKVANMDVEYNKKLNLNWLLTGEGDMYIYKRKALSHLNLINEPEAEYGSDIIDYEHYATLKKELEKAWEQIDFLKKIIETKL